MSIKVKIICEILILFVGFFIIVCNAELYAQSNTQKRIDKLRIVQGVPPLAPNDVRLIDFFEQLGIDTPFPRFGWVINDIDRGERQTAYQIQVAINPAEFTSDQGSLWDSGKVPSAQQFGITYAGSSLAKTSKYCWRVRTWDKDNMVSPWSENKSFVTGFFQKSDWNIGTKWIQHPESVSAATDVPVIFRKTFSVSKTVKQAFLYVTGLGQFVASLNGSKVGNHAIDPAWTDYDRSVNYVTFDVTSQITQGANALGIMLGSGWLNATDNHAVRPFGVLRMMAQLHIDYSDGSFEDVASDPTWKASKSPFTYTEFHGVEIYDARLDQAGWKTATFNDSTWPVAVLAIAPSGDLSAQSSPPVLSNAVFQGKNISSPSTNNYIFDFGQNMNAQFEIKVSGKAGDKVTLTPGEFLNSNGTVNPGRSSLMTYTLKGGGTEIWRQTFSTIGLRYVQVGGVSLNAAQTTLPYIQSVTGYFTYTGSINVGNFFTSDERYNKIRDLALNALRSNLNSIHTDGPNLEKLGWQEVVWTTLSSIAYQHDLFNLYTKILKDVREAQRTFGLCPDIAPNYFKTTSSPSSGKFDDAPAWGASIFNACWLIYQTYGDRKILEDNYGAMNKYLAYLKSKESGGLITYGLGDWMAPGGHAEKNVEGAVYVLATRVMRDVATTLGKSVDATFYATEYERVLTAYNNAYFNSALGNYSPVSQGNLAIPLAFGIVPVGREQDVEKALVEDIAQPVETTSNGGKDGTVIANHVTTGDIGTTFLFRSLGNAGQHDLVQTMIMQPTSPSYLSMINAGETSMPENWNLSNIRSHNHDMYSGIFEWFFRSLGGISAIKPGFEEISLKPQFPTGLEHVTTSAGTVRGLIRSSWTNKNGQVNWKVTVPVNSVASVYIPYHTDRTITEGGKRIWINDNASGNVSGIKLKGIETDAESENQFIVWTFGSGNYELQW